MSDFYMYHYGFTPIVQEQSLFGGDQKKAATPSATLDAVLSDKQLPIHRPDRRGGVEKYGNVCCSPACGVTLIRLKNNCQILSASMSLPSPTWTSSSTIARDAV